MFFDVSDLERSEVEQVIVLMEKALEDCREQRRNVVLAALAELSARFLNSPAKSPTDKAKVPKVS